MAWNRVCFGSLGPRPNSEDTSLRLHIGCGPRGGEVSRRFCLARQYRLPRRAAGEASQPVVGRPRMGSPESRQRRSEVVGSDDGFWLRLDPPRQPKASWRSPRDSRRRRYARPCRLHRSSARFSIRVGPLRHCRARSGLGQQRAIRPLSPAHHRVLPRTTIGWRLGSSLLEMIGRALNAVTLVRQASSVKSNGADEGSAPCYAGHSTNGSNRRQLRAILAGNVRFPPLFPLAPVDCFDSRGGFSLRLCVAWGMFNEQR